MSDAGPRQVNDAGLDLIRNFESPGGRPNLQAYLDPVGVLTIGFGHTGAAMLKRRSRRLRQNNYSEAI